MTIHLKPFKREDFESRNPATGALIETYPGQDAAEVEARLERSFATWRRWSQAPMAERAAVLTRMGELLEERVEDYARLITSEMGKPIGEARGEVKKAAGGCKHFARRRAGLSPAPSRSPARPMRASSTSRSARSSRSCRGTCRSGRCCAFSSPTALVGNTVLVKHAETVQGSALAIEQLVRDAGGPEGLYANLVDPARCRRLDHRRYAHARGDRDRQRRRRTVGRADRPASTARRWCWSSAAPIRSSCWRTPISTRPCSSASPRAFPTMRRAASPPNASSSLRRSTRPSSRPSSKRRRALRVGDPMSPDTKLGPLARADLRDDGAAAGRRTPSQAGAKVLTGGKPIDGARQFLCADRAHRSAARCADRPGGILRPVALLFTVQERRGGDRARQRHRLRPRRRGLEPRCRARGARRRPASRRAPCSSTTSSAPTPARPSAA